MIIRPARVEDAKGVVSMMTESVDKHGRLKYTANQTDAWLACIPTVFKMESLIEEPDRIGWVAVDDDDATKIVGYLDWKQNPKKLDMLYVHPNFTRQKIATRLFQQLVIQRSEALQRNNLQEVKLNTDASEISKPFFLKQGFTVQERQEFPIGPDQVTIHNYKMSLRIGRRDRLSFDAS